jgi:arylsulfatase A-like enzyme
MPWKMKPGAIPLLITLAALHGAAQTKPNIIVVMPDDISFGDFSYFNAGGPRTPNIDKLGAASVRLTDFHVSPSCSPTRAALLTGRHNDAAGVWHTVQGRSQLRKDEITLAQLCKANGYATGLFGKWHLGDNHPFRPKDRGFDRVVWHGGGGVGRDSNPIFGAIPTWRADFTLTMRLC